MPANKNAELIAERRLSKRDLLLACTLAPAGEELLFRGLLLALPLFLAGQNHWAALGLLAVSSLAFAAIHLWNYRPGERQLWRVWPQLLLGLVLGGLYLRFGLLVPIIAHTLYNSAVLALSHGLLRSERAASAA